MLLLEILLVLLFELILTLVLAMADLHQNFWGSQNNILKTYIFNISVANSIKMNTQSSISITIKEITHIKRNVYHFFIFLSSCN